MNPLTEDKWADFLERFGGLDGALILSVQIVSSPSRSVKTIHIELHAHDRAAKFPSTVNNADLHLFFDEVRHFAFENTSIADSFILNYDVTLGRTCDGDVLLDFDPLHATQRSIFGTKTSNFFVVAASLAWELKPKPDVSGCGAG